MSDSDKPTIGDSHPPSHDSHDDPAASDAGRALLVGVLGGLVSAAGYLVYRRLPDEQRDRLHAQVRSVVETRLNEIRSNFNI
jgi:hypothetical protein